MVDHDTDEALARLRASDPATGSHPDLHSLRQRIAHKAPASQGSDSATLLHDDPFRGQGLRAPWIAAAAVAAFGFGAGGYAIGAQQAPDGGGQLVAGQPDSDEAARDDGAWASAGPDGLIASSDSDAGFAGESTAMGGDSQPWDPGPVRLTPGPDLPSERGTGEVRAVVSDEDPDVFLDAWAERIGFEGVRAAQDGEDGTGWFPGDALYDVAGGRMLSANLDGGSGLTFSYEDMFASPWCKDSYSGIPEQELERVRQEWAASFGPDVPFPDASRCEDVSGAAPSEQQALAAAEDFLATTGLDLSGYTLRVPEYQDETVNQVMVEGWPEGQPQGHLMVTAQVGPEGVVSAYGTIGEMTSLGDYPLISAVEAVERYGQREFGMEYGVTLAEDMVPVETEAATMPVEPGFEMEMPEPVKIEPGMKIPMLLKEKVVTGAELTTGSMWAQTSGPLEVPTWKLTTDDGMHYAVLALADEAIEWQSWGE
ncbi:hypothetical protein [Ornithinimicrobium pekingense]|uniref:Uncharacterized protein n=1 Tax=Ornithinimicrobium pekingense TaxID=384677 RepID=A0ABQ2FEV4_9MICO|nr:hypothetical protein [Ornithinimicrobium pekingense]GGK82223.1 hypothetical protein GCM10011509_33440 [Ornithinimicrobium pekingense]